MVPTGIGRKNRRLSDDVVPRRGESGTRDGGGGGNEDEDRNGHEGRGGVGNESGNGNEIREEDRGERKL